MMGPKVFTVPSLAKIPRELLASVYVFINGVKGDGPFGFQVDVFDAVPGEARYTPLRAVTLVSWEEGATPRVLGSMVEIQAASQKGEVTLKRPGVVVNMPILMWLEANVESAPSNRRGFARRQRATDFTLLSSPGPHNLDTWRERGS